MIKLKSLCLLFTGVLLMSACGTAQAPTVEKPAVYSIGVVQPLTGDAAGYGDPQVKAIQLAVEEINTAGGVNGAPLALVVEDGQCKPESAVTAVQKLVSADKVQAIIGGACSGETLAMAPIVNDAKVLLFSASATSPDITTKGGAFVFRNAPSDTKAGSALADRATTMEMKTIAIISENTDYAAGIRKVFKAAYSGQIVGDEVYNPGDTDFRAQLTRIKDAAPAGLIINPQVGTSGGLIAKQARELGITVQFLTNETMGGTEGIKSGGLEAVKGMIFHQETLDETNPLTKHFLDAYTAKYGDKPAYDMYSAGAYDAVHLFADAIKANGYAGDGMRKYLDDLGTYHGALGDYTFDENGDPTIDIHPRMLNDKGENVPYTE